MGDGIRIGVFGGTFDPPHIGHQQVAQEVAEGAELDRVVWVPAGIPPHKQADAITSGVIRGEMVRAALEGNPRFEFSDSELSRSGLSYTVDTLRLLKEGDPNCSLALIVGADQLADFHRWRHPETIASLAELLTVSRDGDLPLTVEGFPELRFRPVPVTRIDISASLIRHRIAQGKSVRYMVPDAVSSIIEREQLYRS